MPVRGEEIGEIKSKIYKELCYTQRENLSREIVQAIDSEFIGYEDELIYKYIFPYMKLSYTAQETDCYIMMSVDVPRVSTVNYFFKEILISIMVVVHEDKMRMNGTNRTRADYIGERINKIFNRNTDITGEPLEYVSDVEGVMNTKYHTRTMRFRAQELNNTRCETV